MERAASFSWRRGLALWFWWVVASALGWAVGTGIRLLLLEGGAMVSSVPELLVVLNLVFAPPLTFGFAQFLVLRQHIPSSGWWVLAGAIGGAMAPSLEGLAVWFSMLPYGSRIDIVLLAAAEAAIGASFGVVGGSVQYLVLRQQLRNAAWWIPANAAAWALGTATGGVASWGGAGFPWGLFLNGGVAAAITGIVLAWLLRDRLSEP